MTNNELIDLLEKYPRKEWKVSMSHAGTFLRVGQEQHSITDDQAEIVWDLCRGAFGEI